MKPAVGALRPPLPHLQVRQSEHGRYQCRDM